MYFVSLYFADAFSSSDGLNGGYSLPRSVNNYELHDSCLIELRKQMNLEKHASLVYKQMAFHFGSVKVVRKGFAKMFEHHSEEEHEHSNKFIKYIDLRGATIDSFNITMPQKTSWSNALEAVEDAIELEHHVTNEIIRIHRIAEKTCKDVHLMNFLENDFIDEQISSINKLMKLAALLRSVGDGAYGEYLIDRDFYNGKLNLDEL
ncbi:Group 30 mite allergen-like protein (Ferritin) [Euroglyphus maynei]|uniref:Ferritin n=1 Tax=Euroglyphus maynei TaxID=6958 RepID=A0A1Y3BG37_EURMA|nr:Group 30 mite allergen-like protein (Ferritin) [Euroglyphus maynei]